MNYSTNYSMREPVRGEKVKVEDINYNTEIIDGAMSDNRQISIDMYDSTSTYNTDDLAGHENSQNRIAVYRCLEDNVTGTWDSTKWVQTNLADEITYIRGNAGASDLGDLNDVDLTNPTDGQALLYDPTSSKWHNSDLPDADVTKTASGNPIEFSDGADAPLVKCTTAITGSQDLHGYDKPWVGGAGKNKCESFFANSSRTTYVAVLYCEFDIQPSTQYTISFVGTAGNVLYTNEDVVASAEYKEVSSGVTYFTFTTKATIPSSSYVSDKGWIILKNGASQSNNNAFSNVQIELGSTATTFAPYSNICPITAYTEGEIEVSDGDENTTTHTTTYPSAIYRGSEDVVNGEVTSEIEVKNISDFVWYYSTGVATNKHYYAPLPNDNILLSCYPLVNWSTFQNSDCCACYYGGYLRIKDTQYDDTITSTAISNFVTARGSEQIAYELATPTTSSVTPTNLPIKSLSGYNHIESSTGEMEVEYFPQKEQPLIDLIPEASNMHEYSTAEHAVGTWIDGKTVYEQTYSFTDTITVTTEWTSTGIASDGIDAIIDSVVGHTTGQTWNGMGCLKDGGYVKLANPYGGSIGINFLIIRYTKPTVSRSLAKGEPEEEIKSAPQETEQVEEFKEEPTEEVKEAPEEPVEEVKEEETKEEGEVNER